MLGPGSAAERIFSFIVVVSAGHGPNGFLGLVPGDSLLRDAASAVSEMAWRTWDSGEQKGFEVSSGQILVNGFICPIQEDTGASVCDVPSGVSFCKGFTSYSACMTSSWAEQDGAAKMRMDNILQKFGYVINRTESDNCYEAVKAFQCAVEFAACEGVEEGALLVCEDECDKVRDACALTQEEIDAEGDIIENLYDLDESAYSLICDRGDELPEDECFAIDYTGPSYYLWAIGLGLAVGFSFLGAVALNLQKLSLMRAGEDTPVIKQPLWLLGFFLLLLGSIMDFVALGLAPASLLAPLAALSLVWNMVAAPCFLKEKLNRHQIAATLIIFIGAVVTVCFSNHTSPTYTLETLKLLFLRDPMKLYTAIVPSLVILHMIAVEAVEALPPAQRASGAAQTFHMLGYAGSAGITGGQSILFAKATAELFKSAFAGAPGLGRTGETYLIITGMIFCMLIQITYLNGGLLHHDSLTVVPIYQAYWIVSGIMGGLVYFDEIHAFTQLQLAMFCVGVLTTIGGVAYLAFLAHKGAGHKPVRPGTAEDFADGTESLSSEGGEHGEDRFGPEGNAFSAYMQATPRAGAADVLLDFGVEPSRVRRLVGPTSQRLIREQQKEIALSDMGVRPDIAAKMIRAGGSDRNVRNVGGAAPSRYSASTRRMQTLGTSSLSFESAAHAPSERLLEASSANANFDDHDDDSNSITL